MITGLMTTASGVLRDVHQIELRLNLLQNRVDDMSPINQELCVIDFIFIKFNVVFFF